MTVDETKICDEIWEKYKPQLHRFCTIKLRSYPDEVDDVISEVFLALCEQVEKKGVPEKPRAWLYGTFHNILNSKYREIYKARDKYVSLLDKEFKLPYSTDINKDIFDKIYGDELKQFLKTELNENEYRLVQYIYYEKLKMAEIAVLENTTEAAIKQRHYRLCNKLRWLADKLEK